MSNSRKRPPDSAADKDEKQTPASQEGDAGKSPESPNAEQPVKAEGTAEKKESVEPKGSSEKKAEREKSAPQKPEVAKPSAAKPSAAEPSSAKTAAEATAGAPASAARPSAAGRMVTNILLALILLVLVLAGAAYVAWPSLPEGVRAALSPARLMATTDLDAAQDRIDTLETRIAELEAAAARPAPATGVAEETLSALNDRMATFEATLFELEEVIAGDRTVANLRGRLDGLSDRIQAMSETLARIEREGATADDVAALRERIQGTAERTEALARRVEGVDDMAANLADRTRLLERQMAETPTGDGMRLSALVLGTGQLKAAVQSGRPFVGELAAIKALGGDEPAVAEALAPLDAHAADGVPTVEMLAERFAELAPRLIRGRPADGDWIDQTLDSVRGLVTVRRTRPDGEGRADGAPPADSVVAAIEQRLAADDLSGAVARLDALGDETRELAAGWRADAQARLDADAALARLDAALIRRLRETGNATDAGRAPAVNGAASEPKGEEGGS